MNLPLHPHWPVLVQKQSPNQNMQAAVTSKLQEIGQHWDAVALQKGQLGEEEHRQSPLKCSTYAIYPGQSFS
jgi:hypothetical protein